MVPSYKIEYFECFVVQYMTKLGDWVDGVDSLKDDAIAEYSNLEEAKQFCMKMELKKPDRVWRIMRRTYSDELLSD